MKKIITKTKHKLRKTVQKLFGYDLGSIRVKLEKDFLDQKKLLRKEVKIPLIFDVGANVGQTTCKYKKLFQKAEIYGFEPFEKVFDTYNETFKEDRHIHPENIALAEKNGVADFFSNNLHYTNSLLSNNPEYIDKDKRYDPIAIIRVKTETIDSYCSRNQIKKINILKMDVQGGELLVLQGAEQMLSQNKIDMIFTEVEFEKIYKNQPLMKDIEDFLKKFGFSLFNLYNISSENNVPIAGDALFIKTIE